MPDQKTILDASLLVDVDPVRALAVLDGCSALVAQVDRSLLKALAALIRAQAAVRLCQFTDIVQSELQDAALTLAANRRHEKWTEAMGLLAVLAFARGNVLLAIAASIQGFREFRASADARLFAARGALWAMSHQPSEIGDNFIHQVRQMLASSERTPGFVAAKGYLVWRDFKRLLFEAGIPTDVHPFPAAVPSLSVSAAKRATAALVAEMESLLPQLRSCMQQDPLPMLFLAGMRGFVSGAHATVELAQEVLEACGTSIEATVHSIIGVAHCRHGEFEDARLHLEAAIERHRRDGRDHLGQTWFFHLAQAYAGLNRHREAYDTLNRFYAARQGLINPFEYQHILEHATAELRLAEQPLIDAEAAPRRTQPIPPYLKKTLRWMDDHLRKPVTALDIVQASGVSRRTLEAAFKTHLEMSIMEELKRRRLRRANTLLRESGCTVTAAMHQAGYTSAPTFSRDFRKLFGITPRRV